MAVYVAQKEYLEHNINLIRKKAGDAVIWGVLKGDGYGLGVVPMAKQLSAHGIDHFAVTAIEEARQLRDAGFAEAPILMLRATCDPAQIHELLDLGATLTVGTDADAIAINEVAAARSTVAEAHMKLDTGMGRYGFVPEEDGFLEYYRSMEHIAFTGIYTHFFEYANRKVTENQFRRFMLGVDKVRAAGIDPGMVHCCNSGSFLRYPAMHCDAVRVGSALLGRLGHRTGGMKPVGYCEATVEEVRTLRKGDTCGYGGAWEAKADTTVAIVGVGWWHGFSVNKGYDTWRPRDCIRGVLRELKALLQRKHLTVTIAGQPRKVLGHVGMVNLVADVTGTDVKPGDRVVVPLNPLLAHGMNVEFR